MGNFGQWLKDTFHPPIQTEKVDGCTQCKGRRFQIKERGARYVCDRCGQNYILKLVPPVIDGKCPDCGSQLFEGPCGGCSMNVSCDKGHKFNVHNFGDTIGVDRI